MGEKSSIIDISLDSEINPKEDSPSSEDKGFADAVSSEPINIGETSGLFKNRILTLFNGQDFKYIPKDFNSISASLQMTQLSPKFGQLCSVDKLTVEDECPGYKEAKGLELNLIQHIPQPGLENLNTLRHLKEQQTFTVPHFKDRTWQTSQKLDTKHQLADMSPLEEVVIKIRVHQPFCHNPESKSKQYSPRMQQEILVLGRHTLDTLRDVITCPNHYVKAGDFSNNPLKEGVPYAKDVYKSGFFFIGDTFYNDMRHPENIDYSKVIREWAATNPKSTFGKLETAIMEKTRFQDLTVRIGYPYVYQHLGNCEHLLVFLNFHLIDATDNLCSKVYPMVRSPHRQSENLCVMCGFFKANWITFNNSRVPHDPAYFCETCFISYNYNDGKKLCDFVAHPFTESKPFSQWGISSSAKFDEDGHRIESARVKRVKEELAQLAVPPRLFAPPNLYNAHPPAI